MSDPSGNGRALVQYADGLFEELRENVQGALHDFDADAIHDARVATRRLSAALDLLKPVLSGDPRKKFERILKKLRRRLGPLRDLDVMLDHLHELADTAKDTPTEKDPAQPEAESPISPSPRPHAQALAWMIDRLESERNKTRKKSTGKKTIPRIQESLAAWWALHDELSEADQAAETLLADSIHLQLDAFAEQAAFHTDSSQAATAASDPHALRKAGKSIRYTLELADETGRRLPPGTIRAFKKMQDALGIWHDYAVLAERIMRASVDEMLAYHNPDLQLRVLDLARFTVKRSARALTRFSRVWQRRGNPLNQSIREAFPLTKAPSDTVIPEPSPSESPVSLA